MLEITDLVVRYGAFLAVDEVSIEVESREIIGVVGPNGAGKSSIVKSIGGLVTPAAGRVAFGGSDLLALPAHKRPATGLSVVPEGRGLFPRMSVEENLLMGGYGVARAAQGERMERCFAFFPILAERRRQAAGTLSGGQQQMLAISVGLMAGPSMLVLDEPSLGLAPIVISEIGRTLKTMRDSGLTVLLFEQNAKLTCSVADRIYIISGGRIQHHGPTTTLMQDAELIDHLI